MPKKKKEVTKKEQNFIKKKPEPVEVILDSQPERSYKLPIFIILVIISLPILLFAASFTYAELYKDKFYQGISVAGRSVGGYSTKEVGTIVKKLSSLLDKSFTLRVITKNGEQKTVKLPLVTTAKDGKELPLISISSEKLYQELSRYKESNLNVKHFIEPISYLVAPVNIPLPLEVDEFTLKQELQKALGQYEDPAQNAQLIISSASIPAYQVEEAKEGRVYNYDALIQQLQKNWSELNFNPEQLSLETFKPTITKLDAEAAAERVPTVLAGESLKFNYTDEQSHFKKDWIVKAEDYAPWVVFQRDQNNRVVLGLDKDKVGAYLEAQAGQYINKAPENAVFKMEGDKVVEFKASINGLKVDIDKTYQDVNALFITRSQPGLAATGTIHVAVAQVEPEIKTADVNNLGISEVIGIGISTFHDSHNNRIKNIANAVKRLNGTLIKPDEEFSANRYAGPYIAANGFLPEAVIKGDEIKNEIGGGMCQIGTTLFRMAMNSGMDITERTNHSLVVGYYADPVNGNPGTDATLYEPIHDLKFKNDTGNYMLLQTEIDYKKQQLTFTLWGKPDGRSGSYTHPLVDRWIGVGPVQKKEVDTLPPGKEKCQSAFPGAVAHFTYTRVTPNGEKIERVFTSYYRALPKICLVGKTVCPEGQTCNADGLPIDPSQTLIEPVVENTTVDPITSG